MKKLFHVLALTLCSVCVLAQQNLVKNWQFGGGEFQGKTTHWETAKVSTTDRTPVLTSDFMGAYGDYPYKGIANGFDTGDYIYQDIENITPETRYIFSYLHRVYGAYGNVVIEWKKEDGSIISQETVLDVEAAIEKIKETDPDYDAYFGPLPYKSEPFSSPQEATKARLKIVAKDIDQDSPSFELTQVSLAEYVIPAPQNLTLTDASTTTLSVSWNAVSGQNEYTVTTYSLDQWDNPTQVKQETVTSTSTVISNLTPKTRYRIEVKAGEDGKVATLQNVHTLADFSSVNAGENMFAGGDFSNGESDYHTYWRPLTTGGTAVVIEFEGQNVLRITGERASPNSRNFWVEENTTYTIYTDIYTSTPRTRLPYNIVWYNKTGERISTTSVANTEAGITGWETVGSQVTSPAGAVMASFAFIMDTDVSVYTGADIVYLDNVSVIKGEINKPIGFRVYNNTLSQRDVILYWFDGSSDTQTYQVEIGGETHTITNGNKLALHTLKPGTSYTAKVYRNGDSGNFSEYTFTTTAITREVKIPYLDNLKDGVIPSSKFFFRIYDLEGEEISKIQFIYNGKEGSIDEAGEVTLDTAVDGPLKIVITQKDGEVTEIFHQNVRKAVN